MTKNYVVIADYTANLQLLVFCQEQMLKEIFLIVGCCDKIVRIESQEVVFLKYEINGSIEKL